MEYGLFGLRLFFGLGVINKQPYHIKQAAEPGYNKNYVNGFDVKIHGYKLEINGRKFLRLKSTGVSTRWAGRYPEFG
jgi:hypothetical protein